MDKEWYKLHKLMHTLYRLEIVTFKQCSHIFFPGWNVKQGFSKWNNQQ